MRRIGLLLLVALWAVPVGAQDQYRESRTETLSAVGTVELDVRGMTVAAIRIAGLNGTVEFEVSNDRQSWDDVTCTPLSGSAVALTTSDGMWTCPVSAMRAIRANLSAYTSGTARIKLSASAAGGSSGGGNGGITGTIDVNVTGVPTVIVDNLGPTSSASYATTPCYKTSTASTNATSCATGTANRYGFRVINPTTTAAYLHFYNNAGSPTCNASIVETVPIPAASAAGVFGGVVDRSIYPTNFTTGIGICITGAADGTTNAPVGIQLEMSYKQ